MFIKSVLKWIILYSLFLLVTLFFTFRFVCKVIDDFGKPDPIMGGPDIHQVRPQADSLQPEFAPQSPAFVPGLVQAHLQTGASKGTTCQQQPHANPNSFNCENTLCRNMAVNYGINRDYTLAYLSKLAF
jgi:hypothetical protein